MGCCPRHSLPGSYPDYPRFYGTVYRFQEKPIEFLSLDGQPVFCLFTIAAPTVRTHLYLLSRLAFALRNPAFKNAVINQSPRAEILELAAKVESGFPDAAGGGN